jgi:hypothetical protein
LDNVKRLGGKVVSATTDGFITNISDLEERILELPEGKTPLLRMFKKLRSELNEDPNVDMALELKNESKGILSYATRGQLGLDKGIKATTGFQSFGYSNDELVTIFKDVLSTREKEFEYTQARTRSSKDVFKKGGHVTMQYKEHKIRLIYDNRRSIIEPKDCVGYNMSNKLFDSKPFTTKEESLQRRFISKFAFKTPYLKTSPQRNYRTGYRSYIEIAVRSFIKGYLAKTPCFGLRGDEFKFYNNLISFIKGLDLSKDMKMSKTSLSHLKHRKTVLRPVPKTREVLS